MSDDILDISDIILELPEVEKLAQAEELPQIERMSTRNLIRARRGNVQSLEHPIRNVQGGLIRQLLAKSRERKEVPKSGGGHMRQIQSLSRKSDLAELRDQSLRHASTLKLLKDRIKHLKDTLIETSPKKV